MHVSDDINLSHFFLIQSNQVSIAQLYSACSCDQATPNMQIQVSIKQEMRENREH